MKNSFNKINSPHKSSRNPESQIFFWALTGNYDALFNALKSGTSVNIIDPVTTDSPLMIACRKGHTDIVKLCLDYGAKNDPHPEFGQTALHASIIEQKYNCAKVILEVAAISDADYIISNLSDPSGQTPLHVAAYLGSIALVELLLNHGSRISSVDIQGQTSLHLCACSGNKICLAMLLDHGGDDFIDMPDHTGNTSLHHASYHGRLECVKLLLETAANVLICNIDGHTAYNIASSQGHHQIGLLLLEYRDHHTISHHSNNFSTVQTPMKSTLRQSYPSPTLINANSSNNDWNNHAHTIHTSQGKVQSQSATHYSKGIYANGLSIPRPYIKDDITNSNLDDDNNNDVYNKRDNVISLNIMPPLPPSDNHVSPSSSNANNKLSIQAPINPVASMYGKNDGLDYIDSIGSFLPRPHTIGSPLLSASKNLRAKSSPAGMMNSPLTLLISENDPVNLENGIGSGYKVISKHSLRRHLSDTLVLNDNNGIKSDNKESTSLSTTPNSTQKNQYSKQSTNITTQSTKENNDMDYMNRINNRNLDDPYTQIETFNTIVASQPNSPERNRSDLSINNIKIEIDDSKYSNSYDNYINNDDNNHIISYNNSNNSHNNNFESYDDNDQHSKYSYNELQSIDYAEPIEEFICFSIEWKVYYTEDNHIYYLDMKNEHSQWEDPRQFGLVHTDYENNTNSYTNSYTDFEPPKSPSPKTHDKGRFFGLNYHESSLDRIKDIKPTKFNWYDNDAVDNSIDIIDIVSLEQSKNPIQEENHIHNNEYINSDDSCIKNVNTYYDNKQSIEVVNYYSSQLSTSSDEEEDILCTGQKAIRIRYAKNYMTFPSDTDHIIYPISDSVKTIENHEFPDSIYSSSNELLTNKDIICKKSDNTKTVINIESNSIDMKYNTLIENMKVSFENHDPSIQEIHNIIHDDHSNSNNEDFKLHTLSIVDKELLLDKLPLPNTAYIINKDSSDLEISINNDIIHQLKDNLIDIMI